MLRLPWKTLFALSILLTLAGSALVAWSIINGIPWAGTMSGVFVVVVGAMLTRMNYHASRHGIRPGSASTLPLVGLLACALVWIGWVVATMHR
jgi:hypothetical protein